MSDTPRTDAFEAFVNRPTNWWDFARELERENAALREKFTLAESEIILLRVERDELREALKPFRDYAIQHGPMNLHGRNSALIAVKHWQRAIYPSGRRSHE